MSHNLLCGNTGLIKYYQVTEFYKRLGLFGLNAQILRSTLLPLLPPSSETNIIKLGASSNTLKAPLLEIFQ